MRRDRRRAWLWAGLALAVQPARAQDIIADAARIASEIPFIQSQRGAGGDPQTSVAQPDASARPSANLATSIQDQLGPYGDPGGFRSFLRQRGIAVSLTYVGDGFLGARGGLRRGSTYGGRLDAQFDADLETSMGWQGGRIHANAYQIHGTGPSARLVGNLMTVSAIEAPPATRLYELWFEQRMLGDRLSLRVGQLAADTEFAVSQTGTLFLNATFGWPNITAVALPSGGPVYPLATPGARVKYTPDDNLSLQVGLFNGDPAGPPRPGGDLDPQRRNRTGTSFRTGDPALVVAEAAYAYGLAADDGIEPGTVTLGGWHHFGRFGGPRLEALGRPAPDPAGMSVGRRFRGDSGLYAMIDQTVYREPDDPNDGASVFVRVSAAPTDRNLVDLYVDAGIGYKGLLPGRSDDTVGVAFALSRVTKGAGSFEGGIIPPVGVPRLRHGSEATLEATYQAVLGPGVTVQPDFQYVFRPGGNADRSPGARIKNAAVLGLRATIRY